MPNPSQWAAEVVTAHWHGYDQRAANMSEPPPIASESVELTAGTKMPILGLGTWQLRGGGAVNAVLRALGVGFDTSIRRPRMATRNRLASGSAK
jgi:hypothetical protein